MDKINVSSVFLVEKPVIFKSVKNFLGFDTSPYYLTASPTATHTLKA